MWDEKWSVAMPTEGEVQDADGNAELAIATKKKAIEEVSHFLCPNVR